MTQTPQEKLLTMIRAAEKPRLYTHGEVCAAFPGDWAAMHDFFDAAHIVARACDDKDLEIARLTADARDQHQRAIDAAETIFHLREALTTVRDNIGVPQPGYPANVAHAYEVVCAALRVKP
jgi:hypothetical protein